MPTATAVICILWATQSILQHHSREGRGRAVVLMGQMYSAEDKRGLFSFPLKAGNGKSVPWRNHVLPGVEGLCRVGGSCQALIRDSNSHLCVCADLLKCVR